MQVPETQYAPNGEIKIAYKVCSQTKKEEGCEKTRQGCSWHGSTS